MLEQIEKLKTEKKTLITEHRQNQLEFKTEIRRIDKAIRNFERGVNALNSSRTTRRPGAVNEIQKILHEYGAPVPLKQIVAELHSRGYTNEYQSISGLMQNQVKSGKRFIKTGPATYSLLEQPSYEPATEPIRLNTETMEPGGNDEAIEQIF